MEVVVAKLYKVPVQANKELSISYFKRLLIKLWGLGEKENSHHNWRYSVFHHGDTNNKREVMYLLRTT
jgi:hypothetical protein